MWCCPEADLFYVIGRMGIFKDADASLSLPGCQA